MGGIASYAKKGKTMSASVLPYPQWQKPLLQAVMETRPDSLMEKIKISETAISERVRELESNPGRKEERAALYNAISTLKALKKVLIQSDG